MQVIMNGMKIPIFSENIEYTYDMLVEMSGTNPKILQTIAYFWRDPQQRSIMCQGTVVPGQSVLVRDGMVFSVVHTGNA
jgi:hypothetical protein